MPKCAFLLAIEYLKMTQMWPCPQGRLGLVKSRWAGNQDNTMMSATKEKSAMCRAREESKKTAGHPGGRGQHFN